MIKINGFYKVSDDYIDLVNKFGIYHDKKTRPIFCCLQDKRNPDIYWLIPTSDISHRTTSQLERIKKYCSLDKKDIRSCYYHIGHTDRPAIFKISNILPVTEKYIDGKYLKNKVHLQLKDKSLITDITKKANRIIFAEKHNPNKFEQHITDIYNYLEQELQNDKTAQAFVQPSLASSAAPSDDENFKKLKSHFCDAMNINENNLSSAELTDRLNKIIDVIASYENEEEKNCEIEDENIE